MHQIDSYAHASPFRAWHPLELLALAGGALVLSIGLPVWPTAPILWVGMSVLTVRGGGVPARALVRFLSLPAGFLVLGALPLCVVWGAHGLRWSWEGTAEAGRLLLRGGAALSCLLFLSLATPVLVLLSALQALGVPRLLVELAALLYRFLFLLDGVAHAIRAAQEARLGYSSPGRAYRSFSWLVVGLLRRSLLRAQRLERGLAARGYTGALPPFRFSRGVSWRVLGAVLGGLLLLGGSCWWMGRG